MQTDRQYPYGSGQLLSLDFFRCSHAYVVSHSAVRRPAWAHPVISGDARVDITLVRGMRKLKIRWGQAGFGRGFAGLSILNWTELIAEDLQKPPASSYVPQSAACPALLPAGHPIAWAERISSPPCHNG